MSRNMDPYRDYQEREAFDQKQHLVRGVGNQYGNAVRPRQVPTQTYADGTTGWSGSSTSRERAEREALGPRQQQVFQRLTERGIHGATVGEIQDHLGVGHGSASSALSNLHRAGLITRLTERRNRQQVYVTPGSVSGREEVAYRPNRKVSDSEQQMADDLRQAQRRIESLEAGLGELLMATYEESGNLIRKRIRNMIHGRG